MKLLTLLLTLLASVASAQTVCPPTVKQAEVQVGAWYRTGTEGSWYPIDVPTEVRFGVEASGLWAYRTMQPPAFVCNRHVFGGDPDTSGGKVCQIEGTAPHTSSWTVPAWQDAGRGQCLFASATDWGQESPTSVNARCASCHPLLDLAGAGAGAADGSGQPHSALRTVQAAIGKRPRQAPDLRNLLAVESAGAPFSWDGRLGHGDAGLLQAITRAVTSPLEMRGALGAWAVEQPKVQAVIAFLRALAVDGEPDLTHAALKPYVPGSITQGDLDFIRIGSDFLFGRSPTGAALKAQGKDCLSCHPMPQLTSATITSNVLDPDAAWDLVEMPDGSLRSRDPGAGYTEVCDETRCVQVGTFRVPSLYRASIGPWMHDGGFSSRQQLKEFYPVSLGFSWGPNEAAGVLDYWLSKCAHLGAFSHPDRLPPECF